MTHADEPERNPVHLVKTECDQIRQRYARRRRIGDRYDPVAPDVLMTHQEKVRILVRLLGLAGLFPVADKRLLEIGCGHGANLHTLLGLGFRPENLVGNDLLAERVQAARHGLPEALRVLAGDALELNLPDASFDLVLQSTVFTSILDRDFQRKLAKRMWSWVKPGGGVLWYDFVYNNPNNPDVRGVPVRRIRELFPHGEVTVRRVTLAPPIARRVCRIHSGLYGVFNALPFLRTHVLCWVRKGKGEG